MMSHHAKYESARITLILFLSHLGLWNTQLIGFMILLATPHYFYCTWLSPMVCASTSLVANARFLCVLMHALRVYVTSQPTSEHHAYR